MKYIDNFLNIDLTTSKNVFLDTFMKAIYEIRSEELEVTIDYLENYGDKEAVNLIRKNSI